AFEPWAKHKVNSSALDVEPLDGIEIEGIKLSSLILPVDVEKRIDRLLDAAREFRPDAVVSFGMLSRGPDIWRVELVARNHDGRHQIQLAPGDEDAPPAADVPIDPDLP